MIQEPPTEWNTHRGNRAVLAHLQGQSAHSDVSDALSAAVKPLGDVQLFCPDWKAYRYVAASTKNVLFAFALGMNVVGFRLDERMKARALVTGASLYPACGADWVSFCLFRDDWPRVDLDFWARKSYVGAREMAE